MQSVFLNANIFFAAVRSPSGGSYFVIELAKSNKIRVVTVAHALAEAERNIGKQLGQEALARHYDNLREIQSTIQSLADIPLILEYRLRSCVPDKDIPIVLGALLSNTSMLLTLDQKHLLRNTKLAGLHFPVLIMTPGEFLRTYVHTQGGSIDK